MNDTHLHLILNHFPIILTVIGILILAGGFLTKSAIVKRTAYFIFILGAITAAAAFATGEGAEEVAEKLVDEYFIEEHEEAAKVFALMLYALGGLSLAGLWTNWKQKSVSPFIAVVTLAFSVVVLFYAQKTGTTGGEIRHAEIRKEKNTTASSTHEKETEQH